MRSFLLVTVGLHALVVLVCAVAMRFDLPAIYGEHPALKPLKFAGSIGVLLLTVAFIVRGVQASWMREAIVIALVCSLTIETIAISMQALRGTTSHYNTSTLFDTVVWRTMSLGVVVAMLSMLALTLLVVVRPLAFEPIVAFAVRASLFVFLLVVLSGIPMVAGQHRGLRVAHFFALHGLQVLPVVALVAVRLPIGDPLRWGAVIGASAGWTAMAITTLVVRA